MIDRHVQNQAQIFGEDAALYERFRPGYPRELMESVIADTGAGPVLEIGAGTGKATRALVALGKRVHAVEPDERMAALLRLNCGPGLDAVDNTAFEYAQLPTAAYDLVLAAQSWHWIDPELAYDRAADALIPHGRLALLWHQPHERQGLLGEALDQLYHRLAPQMPHFWPGCRSAGFDPTTEPFAAIKRFRSWSKQEHLWHRRLDAPSLVGWLCSSSEHRMLGVEQRTDLMGAVAALVQELGGEVVVNMTTVAHFAHRV